MERASSLIDLLLTVGYIDGRFHQHERDFVRNYLGTLIQHAGGDDAWRAHFDEVYQRLDAELAALGAEVVASGDDHYVSTRLKVRALTLFRDFAPAEQASALELVMALVHADGEVSPSERRVFDELVAYFNAAPEPVTAAEPAPSAPIQINDPHPNELKALGHPLLDPLEQTFSSDPHTRHQQMLADYNLATGAIAAWEKLRASGAGKLVGVTDIGQFPEGTSLLDGYVHVERPDHPVELVVLGDLHGCYGCLKGALLQSDFINRAMLHQQDPANHPDIKLVLLGDYIDRGRFSFEGVLRAALQLMVALPDHVILLRGNHEFLVKIEGGHIVSGVNPAEALASIAPHAPVEFLETYLALFEHMPTTLVFERTLFVHGGIPRDDTFAERYRDLSSLGDPALRFQMMWSDPVATDHVPVELQRESPRFTFGRNQFRAFMERIGCHTMIRGHEQIDAGFSTIFDLGERRLHSLFSAGGHDNPDLPAESRYRNVTPMALTIRHDGGVPQAVPWPIRYQPFAYAEHNGLYR